MRTITFAARSTALLAAAALAASGCSSGAGSSDGSYKIAVLAASSQNGHSQAVYEGVERAAKAADVDVDLELLDGQFDANTQLSQLQNAGTQGDYDGVVVIPNDGPSLAAAFPLANDIPVATVLNPIGPDIDEMEPQVDGVVSTVAVPPSDAAAKQAELVVDYCKDIDPCQVVELLGQLDTPLDTARRDAYDSVLEKEDNIDVVATVEGGYDRDTSLTAITNTLQANPEINVILSNADQQTSGAQVALENAGVDPSSIYLTGGGGTKDAVKAVRDGDWAADYVNFPVSMGSAALEQVLNSLEGKPVKSVVNADELGETEPYATKKTLAKTPDFVGEWNG